MSDDFFDGIEDSVDFRKWECEEGDQLGGEVVKVFHGEGEHGAYTAYVIVTREAPSSTEGGKPLPAGESLVRYINDESATARDVPAGIKPGDVFAMKFIESVPSKKKGNAPFKKFGYRHIPAAPAEAPADW